MGLPASRYAPTVGDVVRRLSGCGCLMIVVDLDDEPAEAICAWRQGERSHELIFQVAELRLVKRARA